MIKEIYIDEIGKVVEAHERAFQVGFLGNKFLRSYYASVCLMRKSLNYGYFNHNGDLIGFIVGIQNPMEFDRKIRREKWVDFIYASFKKIIKHPRLVIRLIGAMFNSSQVHQGDNIVSILSIGVVPEFQRKGIGKELIAAFFFQAKNRGCTKVVVTTETNNESSNHFYQELGFKIYRQISRLDGRLINEFVLDIN